MNKEKFIELFEELLEKDKNTIKIDDKFRDYEEWDSLAVLSAGAMINEEYDIVIPRQEFDKIITLGELYGYINKKFKG